MSNALDTTGASDDAAAAAVVSKAAAEAGKSVPSPEAAAQAAAAAEAARVAAEAEVARKAVEAKAAAEANKGKDRIQYEYNPTGDVGLDMALEFIGKLGFSAESTAVQSATKGDFAPMKAALEAMGDEAKGHEKYLALAEAAFTARTKAATEKATRDEQAVYQAVGGKESWDKISEYTRQNADEGEKAAIQAALAAGGLQAQSMAVLLKQAFDRAHPATPSLVKEGASGASGGGSGKLTASEYAAAVKKIAQTTRGPIDNNPQYLALREQFARQ